MPGTLQLRRPTVADRLTITPKIGELLFDTTIARLYIGDGSTAGGLQADSMYRNDHSGVASYTILASDVEKLITFSNASPVAVSLEEAGGSSGTYFPSGSKIHLVNFGAGLVTITPTTSTINGAATLTLRTNQGALITSDGDNYVALVSSAGGGSDSFTLGATVVTLGSTVTTVSSLTLSNSILSGDTTLPGSGQINNNGDLGIGTTPTSFRFVVAGSYTSVNATFANIAGTFVSSQTGTQRSTYINTIFTPSGASLSNLFGLAVQPTIGASTPATITSAVAINGALTLSASFAGTITAGYQFFASDFVVSGGSISTATQYQAGTLTTNNGLTAGSRTNRQINAAGITAGTAGGTLNNRSVEVVVPSGGSSSGATVNRGVYITGNGGTAAGGTVTNHAIYDDSTAPNYFAGGINVGATADPGAGNISAAGTVRTGVYTVATLPAAGTAGRRAFVTNANATTFASIVAGGGANGVPVYDDGTNWRIG